MFIGFLLITTRLFQLSGTAGDRSCMSGQRWRRAPFGAACGIQVKAAVISTPSSLPSSRPPKYVTGVKNCYAKLLTGHGAWGMGHGAWGMGIGELVVNNQ
ncbi:hypothetical protein QUA56_19495 [Microcoleus sp. N3A4]|uniref:hypothetical protein n=1 Tax=Microcoleus sp. N3A4 TaxID=3055379 RepID=UPI002FCEC179